LTFIVFNDYNLFTVDAEDLTVRFREGCFDEKARDTEEI